MGVRPFMKTEFAQVHGVFPLGELFAQFRKLICDHGRWRVF